jgi:hypothetical protein
MVDGVVCVPARVTGIVPKKVAPSGGQSGLVFSMPTGEHALPAFWPPTQTLFSHVGHGLSGLVK